MPIKYTNDETLNRLFLDFDKVNRNVFKLGASIHALSTSSELYLGESSVQFQFKRLKENLAHVTECLP